MAYSKKPAFNFNAGSRQLAITTTEINRLAAEELHDSTWYYQRKFGVYGYMELNRYQKYTLHTMRSTPWVWQSHNTCGFDPNGALFMGKQEIEPCRAKLNEEFCYDQLFDSCYQSLLQWGGRQGVELNEQGRGFLALLTKTLTEQAVLGARLILTVGKLFDVPDLAFSANTPAEIRNMFKKSMKTCKGWIQVLAELGEVIGKEHCNLKNVFEESDFDGRNYIGNVTELFDKLRQAAPANLEGAMNEGGMPSFDGKPTRPFFLVSPSVYNRVADEYRALCNSVTCLNPRLTAEMGVNGGYNSYFIDGMPVVPVQDIAEVDKVVNGRFHFAAITVPGNIALGSSFSNIEELMLDGMNDAGILIQRGTNVDDLGKYRLLAHQLFTAVISDTDYIVATQEFRATV